MRGSVRSIGSTGLALGSVLLLAASLFLLVLSTAAYAATYRVSTIGNDTTGDGSIAHPYRTVQQALSVTVSGDDVSVGPGTFTGSMSMEANVSLRGAGAWLTTLRGTGSTPVIIANGIGAGATISGFTITGGGGSNGGGIFCAGSSPTIESNAIIGNNATTGGGIFCFNSSPTIVGNTLALNTSTAAGAIYSNTSSPVITANTITGNTASGNGGGILCDTGGSPSVTGNTIAGNSANYGGGIYANSGSQAIINNVIAGNTAADTGGGILVGSPGTTIRNDTITGNSAPTSGDIDIESIPLITNCIIWGNSSNVSGSFATYSDVSNGATGIGDISSDPGFVSASSGDYHLMAGSPCLDVATSTAAPVTDRDGVYRPWGGGYDMGAYEYFAPMLHTTTTLGAPSKVKVKKSLKLSGMVSPWSPPGKVTITMTRKVGKKYKSSGSAKVSVIGGAFSYSFKPKYKGSWHFVASYSGGILGPTTYLTSKSGVKSVTVK